MHNRSPQPPGPGPADLALLLLFAMLIGTELLLMQGGPVLALLAAFTGAR